MGYDLHITRRAHWADEGDDITREEWVEYVNRSKDFEFGSPNGEYFADWVTPGPCEGFWVDWSDGQLYTKNPNPEMIRQLEVMASEFGAKVQGDDGEIWQNGEPVEEAPLEQEPIEEAQPRPSLARRLREQISRITEPPRDVHGNPIPFRAGDRVRDLYGNKFTVLGLETKVPGTAAWIQARRDDGEVIGVLASGQYFEPITDETPRVARCMYCHDWCRSVMDPTVCRYCLSCEKDAGGRPTGVGFQVRQYLARRSPAGRLIAMALALSFFFAVLVGVAGVWRQVSRQGTGSLWMEWLIGAGFGLVWGLLLGVGAWLFWYFRRHVPGCRQERVEGVSGAGDE